MGSLLNFVFLNDTLVGNGDGSYGQTGPFMNNIHRYQLNYTLNGILRKDYKNLLPIEVTRCGYSLENVPDEVYQFIDNNDVKLLIVGLADPTSAEAYTNVLPILKNKVDFKKIIWLDSNVRLTEVNEPLKIYAYHHFIESSVFEKARLFAKYKNSLGYVSIEPTIEELNNFRNKKFLSFNRSNEKIHRFALLDEYLKGTFEGSYFSFLMKIEYIQECKLYYGVNLENNIDFYNSNLPIELDTQFVENKESFATDNTFKKELFLNSCINLVTETSFVENELFLSEKILKPILNYQPFIVFGPYRYLAELKKYGFKTFSSFWDESYDEIENPEKRLHELMTLVKKLNNKSIEEFNDIYKSVKEICIHNRNLFYSLELDSLKVILGEIENEW